MTDLDNKIIEWFGLRGTTGDNIPYLVKRTRYAITQFLAEHKFNIGAEIGTRRGEYAACLCKENPSLKLACVDPWTPYAGRRYTKEIQDAIYQEAVTNLKPYINRVKLVRKTSMDALADFKDRSLDFVFIDGNHEFDYVCPDIIFWSYKVRQHGLIIVHDYYHFGRAGVVHAVDAYTRSHHIDPWYIMKEREPTAFWVNQ